MEEDKIVEKNKIGLSHNQSSELFLSLFCAFDNHFCLYNVCSFIKYFRFILICLGSKIMRCQASSFCVSVTTKFADVDKSNFKFNVKIKEIECLLRKTYNQDWMHLRPSVLNKGNDISSLKTKRHRIKKYYWIFQNSFSTSSIINPHLLMHSTGAVNKFLFNICKQPAVVNIDLSQSCMRIFSIDLRRYLNTGRIQVRTRRS